MPEKTIIAHFMHEFEEAAAIAAMTETERTPSYVIGQIDEANIPALEAKGLIVQVLEGSGPAAAEASFQPSPAAVAAPVEIAPGDTSKDISDIPADEDYYIVELQGPLLPSRQQALSELGVVLIERLAENQYTARLTFSQISGLRSLAFVRDVRLYNDTTATEQAVAKGLSPLVADSPTQAGQVTMATYDVRLHRPGDLPTVLDWLDAHHIVIAAAGGRKVRLFLLEGSPLRNDLALLPEVANVERFVPPQLCNDVARVLLGIDAATSPVVQVVPYAGDGEIIGIADTGIDQAHPDFQGRLAGVVARGRPNDPSDPHGHGTHVAGSALGNGTASSGAICGTAPQAQLFFQSIMDAQGGLGGLPPDLNQMFDEAYLAGARVHNNSWASNTASRYTNYAIEVDEFVHDHKDMLVVIAAGNEGHADNPRNSQQGFVDWLSICSPGSAKNGLTVGASRSSRTSGGLAQNTWQQFQPSLFPDTPIAGETISGNPEALAAFSSRGPCDDRRIKPDLVAPGTDILSTKSSAAPLSNYWGSYAANGRYAFMGGTSMAAPLVSGCAALVREYYKKDRNLSPSAALVKATLINGTRPLTGADAVADHASLPNYHQGFGCLHIPSTIPNATVPFRLEFLDTWQAPAQQLANTGERIRLRFTVTGGTWLRICLAWTDLPARALQNNLDLFVQHIPSAKKWFGNADLPGSLKIPDPENNVEVVRLDNPVPGDYLIQITATNLLTGPQDYALVVAGELSTGLIQV